MLLEFCVRLPAWVDIIIFPLLLDPYLNHSSTPMSLNAEFVSPPFPIFRSIPRQHGLGLALTTIFHFSPSVPVIA
jgi:hypothetical protein